MSQVAVTISRSHSGPVYAGTEFALTANISLSIEGVSDDISLDVTWRRGDDVVDRERHSIASDVSGSSYRSSLTYSTINISDSGQITATVTISSMHIFLTATGTESLNIQGMHAFTNNTLTIRYA